MRDILQYGEVAVLLGNEGVQDDLRWRLALERALFLIGEAAARLQPSTRASIRQPWPDIIGLRNLLAHRYDGLVPAILVGIAARHVPSLLAAVRAYLAGRPAAP